MSCLKKYCMCLRISHCMYTSEGKEVRRRYTKMWGWPVTGTFTFFLLLFCILKFVYNEYMKAL